MKIKVKVAGLEHELTCADVSLDNVEVVEIGGVRFSPGFFDMTRELAEAGKLCEFVLLVDGSVMIKEVQIIPTAKSELMDFELVTAADFLKILADKAVQAKLVDIFMAGVKAGACQAPNEAS